MIKLIRYLKPYWASIILVIALLFVQANADLALPDYMSRIVNVGIQQSGIGFYIIYNQSVILSFVDAVRPGDGLHQRMRL